MSTAKKSNIVNFDKLKNVCPAPDEWYRKRAALGYIVFTPFNSPLQKFSPKKRRAKEPGNTDKE